jgi:phosphate transport system permease protein
MMTVARRELLIKLALRVAASTSILAVLLIFLFLGRETLPFFSERPASELLGLRWTPVSFVRESFGLVPLLTGSALVTGIAMFLSIPFGVVSAVYMAEFATGMERQILKPFIELLAGIPSVVLGFFGLVVLAPIIKEVFGLPSGLNALTGGVLLALMAAPTIISISEDSLASVPGSYREASLGLGASRLQTVWRVTVPAALPGVIAAVMLGIGRVIGETMAVMMVTGNAPIITANPLESVRTMTATVAAEMGEVPFGSEHYGALFCVGCVLLLVTFGLNWIAQRVLGSRELS